MGRCVDRFRCMRLCVVNDSVLYNVNGGGDVLTTRVPELDMVLLYGTQGVCDQLCGSRECSSGSVYVGKLTTTLALFQPMET